MPGPEPAYAGNDNSERSRMPVAMAGNMHSTLVRAMSGPDQQTFECSREEGRGRDAYATCNGFPLYFAADDMAGRAVILLCIPGGTGIWRCRKRCTRLAQVIGATASLRILPGIESLPFTHRIIKGRNAHA